MEEGDIKVLPIVFPRDAAGLMEDDGLSARLDGDSCGGERNFPRRGVPDDMSKASEGWTKETEFRKQVYLVAVRYIVAASSGVGARGSTIVRLRRISKAVQRVCGGTWR